MRRSPTLLAAALLLAFTLAAAAPATAQPPQRFELTPQLGYRFAGELDSREFVAADVEVDESAVVGVTFDIPIAPGFQLELLARHQDTAFVTDSGVLEPSEELGDLTVTHAHAGLLFQWGPGQVNGFVVVSGGVASLDPEGAGLDSETRLSGSFGGGLKIFFNRNVGMRFEGRAFWTDFESEFDDDRRRRRDTYDDALVQGEATVGVIVAF
jgi:hypothetical protein